MENQKALYYGFIQSKITENSEIRREKTTKAQIEMVKKNYPKVDFKAYAEELVKLTSSKSGMWDRFNQELKAIPETSVGSLGWSSVIKYAQSHPDSKETESILKALVQSETEEYLKQIRDITDKYVSIQNELMLVLENMQALRTADDCVDYLTELGFDLSGVGTVQDIPKIAPVNTDNLGW